jgi:uncharacterized protein YutE (UPF0331/DUF86 family)
MVDIDLINRKLRKLAGYLEELKPIGKKSFDEYKKDYFVKRTTERCIQLIVECAADINAHILVGIGTPPADYYESFIKVGEIGVIPEDFAAKLAPSAGLRNRLVHEYEEIKDKIVYASINETLLQFTKYMEHVATYLQDVSKKR